MRFQTTVQNRKDVVKAMEQVLNVKAKYLGPPSFDYEVGNYRVDKEGYIESASEEEGIMMKNELTDRGLMEDTGDSLSIKLPLEGFTADSLKNLIYMIHSKQYLLKRSIGTEVLKVSDKLITRLLENNEEDLEGIIKIIEEEDTTGIAFDNKSLQFDKFPVTEEGSIYTELISAMVKVAKEQKRINPQETREANEKYYMRIWLVRLGFGGKEGKEVRRVLLVKLKGHTAFRTEADKQKWIEKNGKKAISPAN